MASPNARNWYALRIRRGMALSKREFAEGGIPTFVPFSVVEKAGKRKEIPLVASLIFVRATADFVKNYCFERHERAYYYRAVEGHEPGIIPDREMEAFMKVTSPLVADARYFEADAPEYHKGDAVEITDGQFAGMHGHIFRVGKDRKVIVSIQNVCSLLISNIPPSYLRKLDGDKQ